MEINKRTKLILSILGVSALLIPAALLLIFSQKASQIPPPAGGRKIDTQAVEKTVSKVQKEIIAPTPTPASPSASPKEGTPTSR